MDHLRNFCKLYVSTFPSAHLPSPISFLPGLGWSEECGWRDRRVQKSMIYVTCSIGNYWSKRLFSCFFPPFLVTKDRAGIQDYFILCCCSGIMPFGSWPSQPAWNQIVKRLICLWVFLFQLSFTSVSSIFPRAWGFHAPLYVQCSPAQEFTLSSFLGSAL